MANGELKSPGSKPSNPPPAPPVAAGRNFLFLIAIDAYPDNNIDDLNNCERDAQRLKEILTGEKEPPLLPAAFPNPFSEALQIRIPESFHPDQVQIAGALGEVVWKATGGIADDLCGEAEALLGRAMAGLYFLEMNEEGKVCRMRVVKVE